MQSIKAFKSGKQQFDLKKSLSKFLDHKRNDCFSRLRALKSIVDAKDIKEVKEIFISNHSMIYFVFHQTFLQLEATKFTGHRKHVSEDDKLMFFIFEKILTLLPELLEKRWQMNSIIFVLSKCLHPGNIISVRVEAMRLFLIYYQILGENNIKSLTQIDVLYASLIPGLVIDSPFEHNHLSSLSNEDSNFLISNNVSSSNSLRPYPIEPFIPLIVENSISSLNNLSSANDYHSPNYPPQRPNSSNSNNSNDYKNYTKLFFTQHLLDFSINQCNKIYWRDYRDKRCLHGFEFLFASFARIYLPYIFPRLAVELKVSNWLGYSIENRISLYNPPTELSALRKYQEYFKSLNENNLPYSYQAQAIVVQWFCKHLLERENPKTENGHSTLTPNQSSDGVKLFSSHSSSSSHLNSYSSLLSISSLQQKQLISSQPNLCEIEIFRLFLSSKRFYIDLMFNLFHQAFMWPFTVELTDAMRQVIRVFKQWIFKESNQILPFFLAEPSNSSSCSSNSSRSLQSSLSNHDEAVCAGYMNMLNLFVYLSSNVFLLEVPSELTSNLEKQVDVSKRVFNIYRFVVMKIEMDRVVWENLVQTLIHVTRCIISRERSSKKEDSLGDRLAPPLFQTLVVTWIKANLHVPISNKLWDDFQQLASSLTGWEEFIKEWSNTMFILNRVMSRYVFHINLNELPLEKSISDRKKELKNKPRTINQIRNAMTFVNNSRQAAASNQIDNHSEQKPNNQSTVKRNSISSSSNSASTPTATPNKFPIQRVVSNESTTNPAETMSHARQHRAQSNKFKNFSLHFISVVRHREHHNHPKRILNRSLSDSCLVLTVQNSLCSLRSGPFQRRYSKQHSSTHSSFRQTRNSLTHSSAGSRNPRNDRTYNRLMPMIDDEIGVDENENCALTDFHEYHHGGDAEGSDYEDDLTSDLLMINHLWRRTLFRSQSNSDLSFILHRSNGFARDNGSDSMIETLSFTAATGMATSDGNSLKEHSVNFDSHSATSTCSSMTDQQMSIGSLEGGSNSNRSHHSDSNSLSSKPVLLGGTLRGWNADASAILWRRMLGVMGDINHIANPKLHKLALECLAKITEDLMKIRDNICYLHLSASANSTVSSTLFIPSLHYFTPWLFEATQLPNEFKAGKLLAYKLLCTIAMYRSEQELSKEFLIMFYLSLKQAISSYDMDLTNIIIKYCGTKFFSSGLWGSSCLLFHFVSASNMIIGSTEVKSNFPRAEALQLLGSLIGFFDVFGTVLCLRNTDTPSLDIYKDLKEHVMEILVSASKREQTGLGRAISFCSLGIFLYREFMKGNDYSRIKEIVNILIAGTRISVKRPKAAASPSPLRGGGGGQSSVNKNSSYFFNQSPSNDNSKFNNKVLCRVACDTIQLLADHANYLVNKHPDFARRIIEGLCYTLELHIEVIQKQNVLKDFKNIFLCIMFCLSHWCMSVNKEFLLNTLVSEDYPGKLHNEIFLNDKSSNSREDSEDENNSNNDGTKPCLLSLIISLYTNIVNFNFDQWNQNQSDKVPSSPSEQLASFGDMDTIDYTIVNATHLIATTTTSTGQSDQLASTFRMQRSFDDQSALESDRQRQLESGVQTVKKAAHLILLHFMNFMGHFPCSKLQSASLSASINENDDNLYVSPGAEKIDYEAMNAPNVLIFVLNDICLMSFVELPADSFDSSVIKPKLSTSAELFSSFSNTTVLSRRTKPIRVIIRNVLGKFAWNCMMIPWSTFMTDYRPPSRLPITRSLEYVPIEPPPINSSSPINLEDDDDDKKNDVNSGTDSLELLFKSIHELTPECCPMEESESPVCDKNSFLSLLNRLPEAADTVALFLNQHYQELKFNDEKQIESRMDLESSKIRASDSQESVLEKKSLSNDSTGSTTDLLDPAGAFQYCRQMIEQFGFLSWEKRQQIEMLSKSQATIRELRHLDNQQCRDKHKIAVIYVGYGQETKENILLNKSGSRAFEEFVSKLGWEVNLATHSGFMGGLQSNLSTGLTAPYFADSFNEIIFHVSTRLEPVTDPATTTVEQQAIDKQQLMTMKMRHLGNDEVHIVWSEHFKEYRRSILATEFGDALIVIYPLPANTYPNLFRIQIMRKPEVPFFGPLFHGAVVHRDELPSLVRATAINASRVKRLNLSAYKPYFEERYDTIQSLAIKHKEPQTFEDYSARVYAPRYDLLQSDESNPTVDPSTLLQSGYIDLEDFIQSLNHRPQLAHGSSGGIGGGMLNSNSSLPSSPSITESISSTYSTNGENLTSSFNQTSSAIQQHQQHSSVSSIRGSRPASQSSYTQK